MQDGTGSMGDIGTTRNEYRVANIGKRLYIVLKKCMLVTTRLYLVMLNYIISTEDYNSESWR